MYSFKKYAYKKGAATKLIFRNPVAAGRKTA